MSEKTAYARITVEDGPTTSFLIAERVRGGWQAGVMNYPDANVTAMTPVHVAECDPATAWDEGAAAGYEQALLEGPDSDYQAKKNPYRKNDEARK